jgi:glycosyltransferase involved in cell wall biosynthesis
MFLGSLSSVRCLHKEFGFDCIDAHYVYPDGFAAVLLGKVLDVPVFVSARGTDINVFPSFPMIRPMVRWALRHATGLIAVSGALRTSIAQLGIPEGNVRIIPNGVDTERFRPVAREEARRTLNLPEHAPVVVSVGSLNAAKRHSLLIQSLVEVAEKYPDLRAYIVGEGPLRSELLTLIEAAGMKDHVVLVGGKPNRELYLWFSAADVSCLASSREGWPNVIMESIACGTPVVATKVGGVPEILDSSELGVLVDGEESAIAAGICAALERTWNRQSLVRIAESRTWKAVAEEVVAYFRHQP